MKGEKQQQQQIELVDMFITSSLHHPSGDQYLLLFILSTTTIKILSIVAPCSSFCQEPFTFFLAPFLMVLRTFQVSIITPVPLGTPSPPTAGSIGYTLQQN